MEVSLPGKGWVHLDPCEAAVDEPLLYQSWGKNQTYILAFTNQKVSQSALMGLFYHSSRKEIVVGVVEEEERKSMSNRKDNL